MTTYLFAGGGTGGHIFPALAIHEQLVEQDLQRSLEDDPAKTAGAGVRSIFICSDRPLDAKILQAESVDYRVIPARPFALRPLGLYRFARTWGASVRAARSIIREAAAAGPVHVVAMGGFIAAPFARAAVVERVPILLVNMDAIPGRANRWIASMAQQIVTSAPLAHPAGGKNASGGTKKWQLVPPIVRREAMASLPAAACRAALGLDPDRSTLLVTGASQGARSINRFLIRFIEHHPTLLKGWQIIHQTGSGEDGAVREAYAKAGILAVVEPFMAQMGLAWGAATLAVSRAGAGSIAEAWANCTPSLFLPYPYHRDQHQRYNAKTLEEAGAAIIETDLIDEMANVNGAGVGSSGPGAVLAELLRDGGKRQAMRSALERLGPADGARQIAEILLSQGR